MPAKPNPGLGLVLGIVLGYVDIAVGSYAAYRLAVARQVSFESVTSHGLPWFALLVALALVTGLLMAPRRIGAGVMVGAGALMGLAGVVVQLLPLRTSADLVKVFQLFGNRFLPYILLDGSVMFMGLVFLVAGIGRWAADGKVANLTAGPGQPAAFAGQMTYPGQQQWGGYPGQQQPQDRPAQYPGQPYPGQQYPGQQYPGQQPPPPGSPRS